MKITKDSLLGKGYKTTDGVTYRKTNALSKDDIYTLILLSKGTTWHATIINSDDSDSMTAKYPFKVKRILVGYAELLDMEEMIRERVQLLSTRKSKQK